MENNVKNTPLMLAARRGDLKIVKLLLQNGAKVNPQNIGGETALHNSSIKGHYEIAKLLIENNANINILSGIGYIGAAGTGTSSTWSFEHTDKYKTQSEASKALSTLCEEYSVQCTSIVECYDKYGSGDELDSCVSESQTEISKSEADKKK